jgi:hypothetical protein
MRSSIALAALALALGWAAPSGAQMMCGPGQTGSTTSAQSPGGMMCGMMRPTQAQAQSQAQPQQRQGMCPCCQMMAMMQGRQGQGGMGGMGGMGGGSMEEMMRQHHPDPQQNTPAPEQRTPGTPETPKQP